MSVRYSSSFGRRFVFVRCKYCCEVQGWTQSLGRRGKFKSLQKIMPYLLSTWLFINIFEIWLWVNTVIFWILASTCRSMFSYLLFCLFSMFSVDFQFGGTWKANSCCTSSRALKMLGASLVAQTVKTQPAGWSNTAGSTPREDPLEEGMATHSSILAWEIPSTEEPGGLQSTGLKRVRRDWATDICTWKC